MSKGNAIERVFELMDELKIYFKFQGKNAEYILNDITDNCKENIASLADIFEELNLLNLQLQGPGTIIIIHRDCITKFVDKLKLWIRNI